LLGLPRICWVGKSNSCRGKWWYELRDEDDLAAVPQLDPAFGDPEAVIECFNNRGLHKCSGYWCGPPEGKHIQVLLLQTSLAMASLL
jgi:hypothetical protein